MANRFSTGIIAPASASGAIFLDLIFATLPILLILVYTLTHASYLSNNSTRNLEEDAVFHKLVSASDIIVKQLAAQKSGSGWGAKIEPNLIDESAHGSLNTKSVAKAIGLNNLYVGFEPQNAQSGTKIQITIRFAFTASSWKVVPVK